MDNMQTLKNELTAEFDRLKPQVIKEPLGYLKYPYLIPAGFYDQLWDWDAFFMACHFISQGQPEYMKFWALTYIENCDDEGYVSASMTIEGQRQLFGKFAMKPFLSQGAYHYSKAVNDFEWLKPHYDRLAKILAYRDKTQFDPEFGLYFWDNGIQSGADNNPAMNYFKDDTRSFVSADASAFQYGELIAQAQIAKQLGINDDEAKYLTAADMLKDSLNQYLWSSRDQVYYNVDRDSKKQYRRISYSSFVPLMYKMASPDQAKAAIEKYLLSEDYMKSQYGLRSLSRQDPDYNNKNVIKPFSNWQGPIWPVANFIYSIALKRYGYDSALIWQAETLAELLLRDINNCGTMHENYHADTGEPLAPSNDYLDSNGNPVGFISWNLCVQNIIEGVCDNKWLLLEIDY